MTMPFRTCSALRRLVLLTIPALIAVLVLAPEAALAHAPIFLGDGSTTPDTAMPLGDPSSPGLIYGILQPGGAQYVSFSTDPGTPFHAMVLRPLRSDALNPGLALVGPGLGDPSQAPFAVPDGDGVLLFSPPGQAVPIFLADLGLRFIAGAGFDGYLPQSGDYFLVIYSADGNGGEYTVGTGYGA
jgi:hypothetical protein